MKRLMYALVLLASLGWAGGAVGEPIALKGDDTLRKVLEGVRGKRVTIRLQVGEELTGRVRSVTSELLHLEELQRREFFDAVVPIGRIEAVIVRVRE